MKEAVDNWMDEQREIEEKIEREEEQVKEIEDAHTELWDQKSRARYPDATCCRVETPGATEVKESARERPFGGCCRCCEVRGDGG